MTKPISMDEKKALAIVLTGNFFEYFDLMLFSHLAFVVSPYFMPKTDPLVAKLLTIVTFSSSFLIRPFAAYFWGYIGDHFGRVIVLSYTTLVMAITCLLIPNIPPYAEWGIYSTIAIIACRVLQGFSSAGESKGAEIFVAEIIPHFPKVFLASALVPITCDLGGMLATILGSICLAFSPEGWKNCFYIGAAIAFCSNISRKKLRETKDFLTYTQSKKKEISPLQQFFEKRNFFALMGLNMICPTAFYFAYSFCSDILKDDIGLSDHIILLNNSSLLFVEILFLLICARLAYRFDPFSILKVRTLTSFILMTASITAMHFYKSHLTVYLAQLIVLLSTASFDPATPVVIRSFGIHNRFTQYSKAWAFAKALMYFTTGFLTYYFFQWFGLWGVLGLLLFFSGIFLIALFTFVPKNKMAETYAREKMEEFREHRLTGKEMLDDPAFSAELPPQSAYLKRWVEK